MRQNSKDVSSADQAIVTVEKASRKVVFTTGSPSQVTMSLVTSSPLAKSAVQVHNLSTQSSPSTHLSLVPPSATVNSVTTPIVSAPPLSIQLARPVGSQVGPNGPHQTLTVVPSGLRIEQTQPSLVVVRQSELQKQQQMQQQQQQNKSEQDLSIVKANSVKELWINRIAPPPSSSQQDPRTVTGLPITGQAAPGSGVPMPRLVNHHVTTGSPMETDTKIIAADKSMIKEMLLKRGGATTLEPASNLLAERRDSNSSTGSNQSSNQIVIQVTKPSFDPNQVKLALPNVSLILTPTTSTVAAQSNSCLTVLSSIPHKARSFPQSVPMNSFPQSLTSFTHSVTQATSSQISAYTSESIKVKNTA